MHEKAVRIGNQTASFAATPTEPFEYAVENGFDAFEWFLDNRSTDKGWEEAELGPDARLKLKQTSDEHDIQLSVHAPWWIDPFESQGYEQLLRSVEFSLDIGASVLNMHVCLYNGIDALVSALIPLIRRLPELALKLSIENTPDAGPRDFNRLFAVLADAEPQIEGLVGMCLDLGHANLYPPTRNDYLAFVDRLDPQVPIIHLHMHENFGDDDSHLPLFSGPSAEDPSGVKGFVERIKRRGFSGCIILEQWPEPRSLLNQARERLIRMFACDTGTG